MQRNPLFSKSFKKADTSASCCAERGVLEAVSAVDKDAVAVVAGVDDVPSEDVLLAHPAKDRDRTPTMTVNKAGIRLRFVFMKSTLSNYVVRNKYSVIELYASIIKRSRTNFGIVLFCKKYFSVLY